MRELRWVNTLASAWTVNRHAGRIVPRMFPNIGYLHGSSSVESHGRLYSARSGLDGGLSADCVRGQSGTDEVTCTLYGETLGCIGQLG
jgi:hypothetical protein